MEVVYRGSELEAGRLIRKGSWDVLGAIGVQGAAGF